MTRSPRSTNVELPRMPGRPKLGVVTREVSLLPQHWEWLSAQPEGASFTLRALIESWRLAHPGNDPLHTAAGGMAGTADTDGIAQVAAGPGAGDGACAALGAGDGARAGAGASGTSPFEALMPPDKLPAIRRLLAAEFGNFMIGAAARVAPSVLGSAQMFKVTVGSADYLIHIEGASTTLRNPLRHYACVPIAAAAGVAARLIRADATAGVCITEFVDATPMVDAEFSESRLASIALAVKTLHGAPLFPHLNATRTLPSGMHYLDYVGGLIGRVRDMGVLPVPLIDRCARHFGELSSAYPRFDRDPAVSSHNNLNPGNVLRAGTRPLFTDWESAFATDRFVDLAALANFFAGHEDYEEIVLRAYFGAELNPFHRARLYLMKQAHRLFHAMGLLWAAAAAQPGLKVSMAQLEALRGQPRILFGVAPDFDSVDTPEGRIRFACKLLREALFYFNDFLFKQSCFFAPLGIGTAR